MPEDLKPEVIRIRPPPPFHHAFCVCLYDVFSAEECASLIARSEAKGYEVALVDTEEGDQVEDLDFRNNDRCILDDEDLADEIFRRIQHALPDPFDTKKMLRLNERLRFLRYGPGTFFRPHYDGAFETPDGKQKSEMTMMLYLNEGYSGGDTCFLDLDETISVRFTPRTGSVCLFEHDILHEGSEVSEGRKYCVRSDVMYVTE